MSDFDVVRATLRSVAGVFAEAEEARTALDRIEADYARLERWNNSVAVCAEHVAEVVAFDGCLVCALTRLREAAHFHTCDDHGSEWGFFIPMSEKEFRALTQEQPNDE